MFKKGRCSKKTISVSLLQKGNFSMFGWVTLGPFESCWFMVGHFGHVGHVASCWVTLGHVGRVESCCVRLVMLGHLDDLM